MSASCPTATPFVPDLQIAVKDPACIESVLAWMWKAAEEGTRHEDDSASAVIRVCLGNLVVVVPDAEAGAWSDILDRLSLRWPSRVIMVRMTPGENGPPVTAAVRAVCHLPQAGSPQVCCEHIELRLGREAAAYLTGLISPLMEPDLPSYLLWAHPAAGWEPLVRALLPSVTCLLMNSARIDGSHVLRERLALPGSTRLIDLAWLAIEPWRRAVANAFDDPMLQAALDSVTCVEIEISPGGQDQAGMAQAVLMLGWFASQLGWKLDRPLHGGEGERRTYGLSGGREILLSVKRSSASASFHGIGSVAVVCADESEVVVCRDSSSGRLMLTACGSDACRMRRSLAGPSEEIDRLIGAAVSDVRRDDAVYDRASRLALMLTSGLGV